MLNDYYVFDTTTRTWTTTELVGHRPTPRERFSLLLYKNFALILFGGMFWSEDSEVQKMYNSIYSLNLQKMTWLKLQPDKSLVIPPRYSHTANAYKDYMYVFGGITGF